MVYFTLSTIEAKVGQESAVRGVVMRYHKRCTEKGSGCEATVSCEVQPALSGDQQPPPARVFYLRQEFETKQAFLSFLQLTKYAAAELLPEGAEPEGLKDFCSISVEHYEATVFHSPALEKTPVPTWLKAERKDLTKNKKELFFLSTENRTKHALYNATSNQQYDVCMRFPGQNMKPCKDTRIEDDKYIVSVYPRETKLFVEGKWNGGYALSYSYGPVTDPEYLKATAKELEKTVKSEVSAFREFLKRKFRDANVDIDPELPPSKLPDDFEERAIEAVLSDDTQKYVDLTWPPLEDAICRKFEGKKHTLAWMRPEDYAPEFAITDYQNPPEKHFRLYEKEIEPGDIDQGALGDCWFLAAVAACAESPDYLIKPMFDNEDAQRHNKEYKKDRLKEMQKGVYRCRLAKHGWWRWNVVDSYLPVQPIKEPGAPCFAKNFHEPNELWVAVVEKTYAKLHGSYVAISGGDPAVAMSDLTGFPTVSFNWNVQDQLLMDSLFDKIVAHDQMDRMLWLSTPGEDYITGNSGQLAGEASSKAQKYKSVGLGTGHAYTILRACKVAVDGQHTLRLLQIRNPWGNATEWTGDWSDRSSKWAEYPQVAEEIKNLYDLTIPDQLCPDDGSYWMSWEDCQQWFNGGGVCMRQKGWQDLRFRTRFSDGVPEHIVKIVPTVNCDCLAFAAQRDRRGLPKDDERKNMCALRVEIVTHGKAPLYDTVAQSHDGVFMYANQVVAFDSKRPEEPVSLEAGRTYYVIVRQHPGEPKTSVRNRDNIVVAIQTSKGSRDEHCRGFSPIGVTKEIKDSWKYVGYYDMSDEGAKPDPKVPCQLDGIAVKDLKELLVLPEGSKR